MTPQNRLIVLSLLVVAVSVSGCRIKSASVAEQQALVTRGGFSGGAPAWGSRSASGGAGGLPVRNSGAIPESYSTPPAAYAGNSANNRFANQVETSRARLIKEQTISEDEGIVVDRDKSTSPLDRIGAICPGIDDDAESALLTEDRNLRIEKYEGLTKRCPMSADLQFWLARDYQSAGRTVEAEAAARNALSIDPEFTGASNILKKISGEVSTEELVN